MNCNMLWCTNIIPLLSHAYTSMHRLDREMGQERFLYSSQTRDEEHRPYSFPKPKAGLHSQPYSHSQPTSPKNSKPILALHPSTKIHSINSTFLHFFCCSFLQGNCIFGEIVSRQPKDYYFC